MSYLVDHAERELRLAGWFDKGGVYEGMIGSAVVDLIKVFSDEGHSGCSAGLCSNLFNTVSRYGILTPLTGKDDEWVEVGDRVYQNKRCSHVFKENGVAHDNNGRIFKERNGCTFTGSGSRTYISFPYTPKSRTVPAYLKCFYALINKLFHG